MLEIVVTKFKCKYKDDSNLSRDLRTMIDGKLRKLDIKVINIQSSPGAIRYTLGDKTLFVSTRSNRVTLSPEDPRRAQLSRDYLDSFRPTEKQWSGAVATFTTVFKRLGIKAKVDVLRDGVVIDTWYEDDIIMAIEKPNRFPYSEMEK